MAASHARQTFRIAASATRQRGLPALGVELVTPAEVAVEPLAPPAAPPGVVVRCREVDADGRAIGELEVGVFAAALIIDRDGILETKAREAALAAVANRGDCQALPCSLPGGSGYRADIVVRGGGEALRYAYVVALASHDFGIDDGVLVVVRSATREWPAADEILRSLRILDRKGTAKIANDDA